MKYFFLTLFTLFLSTIALSQKTTIQVLDAKIGTPVAFAKIYDGISKTYMTDIDGKVTLPIQASADYSFRFFQYRDTTISGATLLKDSIVFLTPIAQVYGEIVITPGINPAHRIIRNAMEHKKENNPLRNDAFAYNSYSKLYMTGQIADTIIKDTITDTSAVQAMKYLDDNYIFLIETKAKRSFSPPNYDKTEITAYNVSGLKKPIIATLLNQFQSFSFYDNYFKLGPTEYVNPIAPGGIRRYIFMLKDTIFHPGTTDTTYTIKYRPKPGKNFKGLQGFLYINTKDWAIQRVIASPFSLADTGGIEVKVTQEYKYTNHKKWFPHKISTEITFGNVAINSLIEPVARGSVYIRDVVFNQVEEHGFNPVAIKVNPGALSNTEELIAARGNTASGKEASTYQVVDSIAEANNFDRLYNTAMVLVTGKIPIGIFSFPIKKIIDYNSQEGFRLGLGVETNSRLSNFFNVGGYFAYGLKDKKWKWGGDLSVTFNQERLIKLKLHYSDDLFERGGTDMYNDNFSLIDQGLYRDFFRSTLDRSRYAGVNLSGLLRQNMKIQLFGNYKRFHFVDQYRYLPLFSKNGTVDKFDIAEVGLVYNWNIREKVMILGHRRVSLGTDWPRIKIKAVKGLKGIFESQYDYYRFQLNIEQSFKIRGVGQINLFSRSGMTIGNVPLTLSQLQYGTGTPWSLSVKNTFQTMQPAEFFSDRYSSFFLQLAFLSIKNKTSWTAPQFVIHSAIGYGEMSNRASHDNFDFKTPNQGYYESGLVVNNLLKVGPTGFGIGAFYRYGPYALPKVEDNFFYKVSLTIQFLNNN